MSESDSKSEKKSAKAAAKIAKAQAKAQSQVNDRRRTLAEVGITIRRASGGDELVVSGLSEEQLKRILPQLNKEVLISLAAEHSSLRAGLMRFVREGIFQTIIKVMAGLVVGFVLIKLGLG